jgi:amino acid adenylation domain-containing protein
MHSHNTVRFSCLSKVIGILSILLSGASYCPLSPDQPPARLVSLIEQVQPKCVLMHSRTSTLVSSNCVNIEMILSTSNMIAVNGIELMSSSNTAYLVFTSGSTGTPKVVPISHRNFTVCMKALADASIMQTNDVVLQVTPVTFDIHLQEILGTLWLGGALVLFRPKGNLDMHYFTKIIQRNQATLLIMVPTLITVLIQHLCSSIHVQKALVTVRRFCSLGEALVPKTAARIYSLMDSGGLLYNLYGPAECTLISTFHLVNLDDLKSNSIPIGRPLAGYTCHVLDVNLQPITCGHQTGQLFIGGDAVFNGYLNRTDLTDEVLVHLPHANNIFYRTGDLVRIDARSGVLCYVGRNDFQIKLRGQRIELGEIEATIIRSSLEISNCIVIKHTHDHLEYLVAYIQTSIPLNTSVLRDECSTYLPLHMVPSLFIVVDQLPLNSNGKIDRKALPTPDFTLHDLSHQSTMTVEQPRTEIEQQIAFIWMRLLSLKSIPSMNMSFFRLGGHSLLLMKLHHLYQTQFQLSIDISHLFRHTTIAEHIRLFQQDHKSIVEQKWSTFNVIEGRSNKYFK